MATTEFTPRGSGVAVIVPLTIDVDGKIDGIGTPILLDAVVDTKVGLSESSAAANSEFVQILLDNGITVETPKRTKTVDMETGTQKASGGGSNGDTMGFSTPLAGLTKMQAYKALRGNPVLVGVGLGEVVATGERGAAWLIGTVGKVDRATKGEEVVVCAFEFTGKEYSATAGGTTALAYDPAAITPVGGSPVDLPGLAAGDVAEALTGVIIFS